MSDLPRPWFSESLLDYARRCARPPESVREYWSQELAKIYEEWRAAAKLPPAEEMS